MNPYRFATLFVVLLVLKCFAANAQTWNWATNSNPETRYLVNVVADQNGYIYAAGIDSLGYVLTKYKPNGVKIWSKTDSLYTEVYKLSIDSAGNLYITATSYFSPGTLIFTARLDSAGNRLWIKGIFAGPAPNDGGTGSLYAGAADSAGNTYMSGYFTPLSNLTQFDTIPVSNLAPENYFLVKYNSAGKIQWVRFFNDPVYAIACGPQGSYFVECGTYFQKYAANGTLIWQQSFSGTFNPTPHHYDVNKLKADAQGNLYVLGNKLAKYNSNGTLAWIKAAQTTFSGYDFSLTNAGNILLTGSFTGNVSFGNGVQNLTSSPTTAALFVAQFSGVDGTAVWAKQNNTSGSVSGESIYSLPNESCVVAGNFKGGSTFDQHSITGKGFFVAKLAALHLEPVTKPDPLDPVTEPDPNVNPEPPIACRFCPNPANSIVTINMPEFGNGDATIYNTAGQKIYTGRISEKGQLVINVTDYSGGMYLVKINSEGKTETQKLIVTH